jgi:hypothetical protein
VTRVLLQCVLEVLDLCVGSGKEEALMTTVLPTDHIWRTATRVAYSQHLTITVVFADVVGPDHDAVSNAGTHALLLSDPPILTPRDLCGLGPKVSISLG